jgi:hypothetical protein
MEEEDLKETQKRRYKRERAGERKEDSKANKYRETRERESQR